MMPNSQIKILLAQMNPIVGDISGNLHQMLEIIKQHANHDLIIFPELALCGYPPDDLLLFPDFWQEVDEAVHKLKNLATTSVIFGFPRQQDALRFNSLGLIMAGKFSCYDKQSLPNDSVFQESRYFHAGNGRPLIFKLKNVAFAVLICEDIWHAKAFSSLKHASIDGLIIINASPYVQGKLQQRLQILKNAPVQIANYFYVNCVGGQDDLIFDGQSFCMQADGQVMAQAAAFQEDNLSVTLNQHHIKGSIAHAVTPIEELYQALQLGLRDFVQKNHLQKVVLGLSGGIDSAVCLAIACQTLGAHNVHALLMPSPYTAPMSIEDAEQQAKILGVKYEILPISSYYEQALGDVGARWQILENSLTSQNLQARLRGLLLMAYANQHQALLISTSNKSETAVGYCTLYGDMCGGYAVLKDVYKTKVYELAHHLNTAQEIIPWRVIQRPPSAELAPNQTDQDDLPPYPQLDAMLIDILEHQTPEHILLTKYPADQIKKVFTKLKNSEFKRFQGPPGPKVTMQAFGKDWRMPISNRWKI